MKKEEFNYEEKKKIILSLVSEHYKFDFLDNSDETLAELILKVCKILK